MDDFNHMMDSEYTPSAFQMPGALNNTHDNNLQQQQQEQQLHQQVDMQMKDSLLVPMENNTQTLELNPFEPSSGNTSLMSTGHITTPPSHIDTLHATDVNEQIAMQSIECENPNSSSVNINENQAVIHSESGDAAVQVTVNENAGDNHNTAQTSASEGANEGDAIDDGLGAATEASAKQDDAAEAKKLDGNGAEEAGQEKGGEVDEDDEEDEEEEEEKEEIDKNQCRICLSKDNLLDIFKVSNQYDFRVSDLIMKICTSIKIGERDYLPHYVCANCEERIESAYALRLQCEESEKLLRSKLKRSKKTRRGPTSFVIIDAEPSSDSNDENQDDDEFHLSEESEDSDADSDASYEEKKKRPQTRRAPRRKPPPKQSPAQKRRAPVAQRSARNAGVVYIDAAGSDDDGAVRKKAKPSRVAQVFKCPTCNRICGSADQLKAHMQVHASEKCRICGKEFKHRPTYLLHIQKHNEGRICTTCHLEFATKHDCRRHMQMAHTVSYRCNKCRESFPSKGRLDSHKCDSVVVPAAMSAAAAAAQATVTRSQRKPEPERTPSTGRDLFKSVAPLTTTYWSDSFSD